MDAILIDQINPIRLYCHQINTDGNATLGVLSTPRYMGIFYNPAIKVISLLILFFMSSIAVARTPIIFYYPPGFYDRMWVTEQMMHLQTQQQLQQQDLYRRQLLMQDQERQLQKIMDQQDQLRYMQDSSTMHEHSNRLKYFSYPHKNLQKKPKKNAQITR
jgi:hypothetical protein